MYLCLTQSSECMTVYILCTVVKYEIWFCCCYSFVLVQHGTSCVNLRLERIIISKYLWRTELPTAQQALYGESQNFNNLGEVYRVQQPNNAL